MSKRIWLGPVLGTTRERLISRCLEQMKPDEQSGQPSARSHPMGLATVAGLSPYPFLYLAASRPLLDHVTERLIESTAGGMWGPAPVHLFRGFVTRVLTAAVEESSGTPIKPRTAIDREDFPLKRSLLSRIMKRLTRNGQVNRIAPLSEHEGCINSVASLIGEIQRAGLDPAGLEAALSARAPSFHDFLNSASPAAAALSQVEIDREVFSIYRAYHAVLTAFELTEEDADQMRALDALRGELDSTAVSIPWLDSVRLLILDGFFDFTPIQGEIIKLLVTRVPEVIVSLNWDERNAQIFRPFEETIERLKEMAEFEVETFDARQGVSRALSPLRERLFRQQDDGAHATKSHAHDGPEQPSLFDAFEQSESSPEKASPAPAFSDGEKADPSRTEPIAVSADSPPGGIRLLECDDRLTEIRTIAKETKRLIIEHGYSPSEICLVVRQQSDYANTIIKVFDDESIPQTLQRRMRLVEIPAVRAVIKLLRIIGGRSEDDPRITIDQIADIIKSGYFRLSPREIDELKGKMPRDDSANGKPGVFRGARWTPDEIENVIAYVGAELEVTAWLARARHLAERVASDSGANESEFARSAQPPKAGAVDITKLIARDQEPESILPPESGMRESRARPSTRIPPLAIQWSALVVERVAQHIGLVPLSGPPGDLSAKIQQLLTGLGITRIIQGMMRRAISPDALARGALSLRGMEGVRRAMIAALEAIKMTEVEEGGPVTTAELVEEILRSIRSQLVRIDGGARDGVRVLEATELRGLRFRAIFVAGLIEGGFPVRPSRDWIYPQEQREQLKEYGLSLEDISPQALLKEEHYFYQVVCRAGERLYLSRPLVTGDTVAAPTSRSYYIGELRNAVHPYEVKAEIFHRDYSGHRLADSSTPAELAMSLARAAENAGGHSGAAGRLMAWAANHGFITPSASRRIRIERERDRSPFGRFDGLISDVRLIERMTRYFGERHIFSATGLSMYGKCPFRFFSSRVLGMEPRSEAALDLKATDAGELLHEIMRTFMENHRGQALDSSEAGALKLELLDTADRVFDRYEQAVPPLNPYVWKIDRRIRKLLLEQVLEYELTVQEKTKDTGLRPAFFELAFGMKSADDDPRSTDKYLEIARPTAAGEPIQVARLRGRIDRVDVAPDGTVLAYDYKLSKGATVFDMRAGRDVQLGAYLAALENLILPEGRFAGGGFYAFRGGSDRRNNGLYRQSFSDYTGLGKNVHSNMSDSEWQAVRADIIHRVWEFMDGMRAGSFVVRPSQGKKTCELCDFSAVCRYEPYRMRRKLAAEPPTP